MAEARWQTIPLDLLPKIITQLSPTTDKSTLCAAALSSTILRAPAQLVLFSHPSLNYGSDYASSENPDVSCVISFLQTVAHSPDRLALYVRAYSFWPPLMGSADGILFELSCLALKIMVNLQNLYLGSLFNYQDSANLLIGCTFQLEELGWGSERDDVYILQEFLPAQKALRHLRLKSRRVRAVRASWMEEQKMRERQNKLCPNLITLIGERGIIDILLPGKKIRYLCWERTA